MSMRPLSPRGNPGYIYAVECDGHIKIGQSTDPWSRVSSLGSGSPHPMKMLGYVPTEDMDRLEADLHARYSEFRVSGEWFHLPDERLKELLVVVNLNGPLVQNTEKQSTSAGAGVPDVRVERPSFKPKGTSITLYGCGRRDGSDVNNSMGLVEAYRWVVLGS